MATILKRVAFKGVARRPKASVTPPPLDRLRKDLAVSAKDFARMTGYSERAILGWEAGAPLLPAANRRLTEVRRLFSSLAEIVDPKSLPVWFQTPNDAFDGLKPLEVVERGESDRLWQMIYFLESGVAT